MKHSSENTSFNWNKILEYPLRLSLWCCFVRSFICLFVLSSQVKRRGNNAVVVSIPGMASDTEVLVLAFSFASRAI